MISGARQRTHQKHRESSAQNVGESLGKVVLWRVWGNQMPHGGWLNLGKYVCLLVFHFNKY